MRGEAVVGSRVSRSLRMPSSLRATGPVGMICLTVIVVAVLVAVFGRFVAPYDPNKADLSLSYVGPESGHPLGYDGQGRDILSRLLAGAMTAMLGPLAVVILGVGVGATLAIAAAWRRGAIDSAISSGLDIVFAFPGILLAILVATVFGPTLLAATIAISIAYTPYVARVLRGAALKECGQAYVSALEVQGVSGISICLRHLVPNLLPLIIAQATIMFGWAMVDLAAISYLGLGVQPPDPDWGVMIAENQAGILQSYPIPSLTASLCIIIVVIAFNVLGERLLATTEGR
ncbi:MAG: ABC transporter permease [Thermoleophilia bacterium]